jgi:hypothetical protein
VVGGVVKENDGGVNWTKQDTMEIL